MQEKTARKERYEWLKALIIAFAFAAIIRIFFLTPIMVSGISMMPTLHDGDRMIVKKFGTPERFEIVVFHAPEKQDYIKRVIGLPGDEIRYQDDVLYINGESYEEPYLNSWKERLLDFPLTEDFTLLSKTNYITVPDGHIFVMGDNRRQSKDSRHIGVVPLEDVVGRTSWVFWPLADFGKTQ